MVQETKSVIKPKHLNILVFMLFQQPNNCGFKQFNNCGMFKCRTGHSSNSFKPNKILKTLVNEDLQEVYVM